MLAISIKLFVLRFPIEFLLVTFFFLPGFLGVGDILLLGGKYGPEHSLKRSMIVKVVLELVGTGEVIKVIQGDSKIVVLPCLFIVARLFL